MERSRALGILCHPTSLPGPSGIGDLGAGCDALLAWCQAAGATIWQVLPLVPTGYGDSPYQPFSVFAGNPLLIDLQALTADGLLTSEEIADGRTLPVERTDYGAVIAFKDRALRRAYAAYCARPPQWATEQAAFEEANAHWLEDYVLFVALKHHYRWAVWTQWERGLALRDHQALADWRNRLKGEIGYHRFVQFVFDRQWRRVRAAANVRGVRIMGDMPIFVGHDSADVWANQDLFALDREGRPSAVAGVPPDYFCPTGQLWGNPHYRWDLMAGDGYRWWVARLRRALEQVDLVRIDHFRGFAAYWQVAAGEKTAINGAWVPGPGAAFFEAVREQLGRLPIIAEDLGLITPDVVALRQAYGFPGMKVLQFAFDSDATNEHLPHNLTRDCVVYTGTHDNDTTLGWYNTREPTVQHRVRLYTGTDGTAPHWSLIRLAMTSVADSAIVPLQDVLGLGSEARFNSPGRPYGNWAWRFRAEALDLSLAATVRELTELTGRCPRPTAKPVAAEAAASTPPHDGEPSG